MQNLKDSLDPITAINTTLALFAKAFKVNTIPTNNNQKGSLIPRNSLIAQPGMNTSQDIKMQMVDDNVRNHVGQNAVPNPGIRIVENMNGLSVVSEVANQYKNRNVVTTLAEGNGNGINGIQSTQEEFTFMAATYAYEETMRVKVNCTSEETLQQAYTSGTQSDIAPVYDSDGSTEVSEPKGTTKGTRTNIMFIKQSILGKPPFSSSYKLKLYSVTHFPKSSVLPKVDKKNALSKPVTSNSAPFARESKVVQTVNLISLTIFRTNPS
nr:hypothetical protein [Tanacetum cinerariifolium]